MRRGAKRIYLKWDLKEEKVAFKFELSHRRPYGLWHLVCGSSWLELLCPIRCYAFLQSLTISFRTSCCFPTLMIIPALHNMACTSLGQQPAGRLLYLRYRCLEAFSTKLSNPCLSRAGIGFDFSVALLRFESSLSGINLYVSWRRLISYLAKNPFLQVIYIGRLSADGSRAYQDDL